MDTESRHVAVIGAPTHFGQTHAGVELGPAAIRHAGLVRGLQDHGLAVDDTGDLDLQSGLLTDEPSVRLRQLKNCVAAAISLKSAVIRATERGHIPLVLGGDHSLALGSVAASAEAGPIGVLWIDAHGDFNTDVTTPSGNIHGMPLAALCGFGDARLTALGGRIGKVNPTKIAIVGARDVDVDESSLLAEAGVHVYSMAYIKRHGLAEALKSALDDVRNGTVGYHVSYDLDVIDPLYAPGVGTPVPGGLTDREGSLIAATIASTPGMLALDIVEVNPTLDQRHITARLAASLAVNVFGQRAA